LPSRAAGVPWEPHCFTEDDGYEHNGSAGIECDGSGGFRVDIGSWSTAPCGIVDCVRTHEETHIDYRLRRGFKDSCKKADGKPIDAGVKPPPLPADDLKKSECAAFTAEIACQEANLSKASAECKPKIEEHLKADKAEKERNCGGGC
jgi:hypothetical protein